mmetsp:Transcript_55257/g.110946  ORF Transcript_55257/g.110946 Transcript_55257/m.110946 type:complete len:89 (+) Transcript_55257:1204-1470(+)
MSYSSSVVNYFFGPTTAHKINAVEEMRIDSDESTVCRERYQAEDIDFTNPAWFETTRHSTPLLVIVDFVHLMQTCTHCYLIYLRGSTS